MRNVNLAIHTVSPDAYQASKSCSVLRNARDTWAFRKAFGVWAVHENVRALCHHFAQESRLSSINVTLLWEDATMEHQNANIWMMAAFTPLHNIPSVTVVEIQGGVTQQPEHLRHYEESLKSGSTMTDTTDNFESLPQLIKFTWNLVEDDIIYKLAVHLWYARKACSERNVKKYVDCRRKLLLERTEEVKARKEREGEIEEDLAALLAVDEASRPRKRGRKRR